MMEAMECSICMLQYDDIQHCPRLLQCGHTFCTECIDSLLTSKQLKCPLDNKESSVTGKNDLPKNFALLDVLQAASVDILQVASVEKDCKNEQVTEVECQVCDGEKHEATYKCLNCEEFMCDLIMKVHKRSKGLRDHTVFALKELREDPKLESRIHLCSDHTNEPFRYYDTECKIPLCRECFPLKHNGHKFISLPEAAAQFRVQINGIISGTVEIQKKVTKANHALNDTKENIYSQYLTNKRKVENDFERLHQALFAKKEEMMNQLDDIQKKEVTVISERQDHLNAFIARLEEAVQQANEFLASSSDIQLIIENEDLISGLAAFNEQIPYDCDYTPTPFTLTTNNEIFIEYIQKLDTCLADAAESMDSKNEHVDSEKEIQEMQIKMDKMTDEITNLKQNNENLQFQGELYASVHTSGIRTAASIKDSMGIYQPYHQKFNDSPVWKLVSNLLTRFLYRGKEGWYINSKLAKNKACIYAVTNKDSPFSTDLRWKYNDNNDWVFDDSLKVAAVEASPYASLYATGLGAAKIFKDKIGTYKLQETTFNGSPVWKLVCDKEPAVTEFLYVGKDGWNICDTLDKNLAHIHAFASKESLFNKALIWKYYDGTKWNTDYTIRLVPVKDI